MRRVALVATLAFALLEIAPALAADLGGAPRRAPHFEDPYPPPLAPIWTGLYVGGTVGYGWASDDLGDGAAGTLFAGYNWQQGGAVLGIEADVGIGDFGGTTATILGPVSIDTNVFGSVRARAGILATPALLIYATGGLAWADLDVAVGGVGVGSDVHYGYQIGAGAEMKISHNVTARLEYLYTDLESAVISAPLVSTEVEPDFHTVRAGLALRF